METTLLKWSADKMTVKCFEIATFAKPDTCYIQYNLEDGT